MSIEPTIRDGPWRATSSPANSGSRSAAVPTATRAAPDAQRPGDVLRRPEPAAHLDPCPAERLGDDPAATSSWRGSPRVRRRGRRRGASRAHRREAGRATATGSSS